jgi:hypothetical protein
MLRPGDILYRQLRAGTWDIETYRVAETAYQDRHTDSSLFVARIVTPREVFRFFCDIPGYRKAVFGRKTLRVTPEMMWGKGIGVGSVEYDRIIEIGLNFRIYNDMMPIDHKGHCEVVDGNEYALELSAITKALSAEEILR